MRTTHTHTPPAAPFRCAEILFRPALIDRDCMALPDAIGESISKCDLNLHRTMLDNIVLHGGGARLPGLAQRLWTELTPASSSVRIITPPADLVYFGGALLAGMMDELQRRWIRKEEWEEEGPRCVRRCVY